MPQAPRRISFALLTCLASVMTGQEISNWAAPPFWSPTEKAISKDGLSIHEADVVEAVPTAPLHFVGLTPCRLVDTRGNGFTEAYGPPSLVQGVPRNFVLAGPCGISPTAQAVSLNVTVTNTQGPGHIVIYPQGGVQPTVSTLNYVAGQTLANAAVVPLGTGGGITVIAGVSGANLIIDTNGDYRGGVVTALSGLSGNVSLTAGSNVTITPSGQSLSIATTGGPGGLLPAGTTNQTLRHNGSSWVANSALTNDGTHTALTGILTLPQQAQIKLAVGDKFIHNTGSIGFGGNTFVGAAAGSQPDPGFQNTGIGYSALFRSEAGSINNVGVGQGALTLNVSGDSNVAVGFAALQGVTTGSANIGIGNFAGNAVSTGSNNIYIGNLGSTGAETGQIRVGTAGTHVGVVVVGISGQPAVGGSPVYVNPGGRLGTDLSSSSRFKEGIRDIAAESEGLMKLRPVAFRYRPEFDPVGAAQYGLIAEEVAEVYPDLVTCDGEGQPVSVRYHLLDPMLLNEIQKQHRRIEAQRAEMDELEARLARLETALEANPGLREREGPLP